MDPPCYLMVNRVFPAVKILTARILSEKYGKTQKEIAKELNLSQSMVSRYLNEKKTFNKEIFRISEKIAEKLAFALNKEVSTPEILEFLCTTCFELRKNREICSLHKISDCNVCLNLYTKNLSERREVIENMEKAAEILEKMTLNSLIPEVRTNIAMAVKNPKSYLEIAAFPGRLTEIKGKLRRISNPEFGASKHISGVLISVMEKYPENRAILNLKYNKSFKDILEELFTVFYIKRKTDEEEELEKIIKERYNGEECIVDPGAFGIEPCLYILGRTALDTVEKVRMINERIMSRSLY